MTTPNTAIETVSGRLLDLADPQADQIVAEDIAWALSREPRFGGHTITALPYSVAQHSIQVALIVRQLFQGVPAIRRSFNKFMETVDLPTAADVGSMLGDLGDTVFRRRAPWPRIAEKFALLHDASEAYMRDLPSPVKSLPGLREAYLERERAVMEVVWEKFGLSMILLEGSETKTENQFRAINTITHFADLYARTVEAYHFMPSRGAHWASNLKASLVDIQKFEMPKEPLIVYDEFLLHLKELSWP